MGIQDVGCRLHLDAKPQDLRNVSGQRPPSPADSKQVWVLGGPNLNPEPSNLAILTKCCVLLKLAQQTQSLVYRLKAQAGWLQVRPINRHSGWGRQVGFSEV